MTKVSANKKQRWLCNLSTHWWRLWPHDLRLYIWNGRCLYATVKPVLRSSRLQSVGRMVRHWMAWGAADCCGPGFETKRGLYINNAMYPKRCVTPDRSTDCGWWPSREYIRQNWCKLCLPDRRCTYYSDKHCKLVSMTEPPTIRLVVHNVTSSTCDVAIFRLHIPVAYKQAFLI